MLLEATPADWLDAVLNNFEEFLIDHAANERKASAVAVSLIAHYPDKPELLTEMVDLALEEMSHYRQVMKLMIAKGIAPRADEKDPYVNQLKRHMDKGPENYLLDRLLTGAIIEARGAERFGLIANAHPEEDMQRFYTSLARSEAGHHELFIKLANRYYSEDQVQKRWQQWLKIESDVMNQLPIRPRLH